MSSDAIKDAKRAERDLDSHEAKHGTGKMSDTTLESGIDAMASKRFTQDTRAKIGPEEVAARSDRKPLPEDEGGSRDTRGRLALAGDFQGVGGPEEKVKIASEHRPGDDDTLTLQDMKREGIDRLEI